MPNIRIKLLFLLIYISLASCQSNLKIIGSDKYNLLSKKEMLEDYETFQAIYEKANSGLYKYHTKTVIDSVFSSNKNLISEGLSYREFYNILWNVIDYTGSCHNTLGYPEVLNQDLYKEKIFFPIPLKYIENKLYTNFNFNNIPAGSEIISVNDIPENEFSSRISKYVSTDGFNTTGKYENITTNWLAFHIYLALGQQKDFKLTYKTPNSNSINELKISSVTYLDFYMNHQNRFSKAYEDRKIEDYSFKYLEKSNTGILEVNSFGLGGPESEGHKIYATFLDSLFVDLKQKQVANLIVDIRGNGGGDDPNDLLLNSYLTQRPFRENTSAFTIFQDIPFDELYMDDDKDELPIELKAEHNIFKDGKYNQNANFNKDWLPNPNAFKGNLVVLIDPFVASAASLFASLVKSDNHAIFIGDETLGGYYGHTGHIPVNYELPNSKLVLTFSIVDLEQDVVQISDIKYGDGIKPHYKVVQTLQDFFDHKDTQMNFALDFIKKNLTH